ncbi:MAG: hypothetical protein ACT4PT_08185 [Methanobacteriota archaeon]
MEDVADARTLVVCDVGDRQSASGLRDAWDAVTKKAARVVIVRRREEPHAPAEQPDPGTALQNLRLDLDDLDGRDERKPADLHLAGLDSGKYGMPRQQEWTAVVEKFAERYGVILDQGQREALTQHAGKVASLALLDLTFLSFSAKKETNGTILQGVFDGALRLHPGPDDDEGPGKKVAKRVNEFPKPLPAFFALLAALRAGPLRTIDDWHEPTLEAAWTEVAAGGDPWRDGRKRMEKWGFVKRVGRVPAKEANGIELLAVGLRTEELLLLAPNTDDQGSALAALAEKLERQGGEALSTWRVAAVRHDAGLIRAYRAAIRSDAVEMKAAIRLLVLSEQGDESATRLHADQGRTKGGWSMAGWALGRVVVVLAETNGKDCLAILERAIQDGSHGDVVRVGRLRSEAWLEMFSERVRGAEAGLAPDAGSNHAARVGLLVGELLNTARHVSDLYSAFAGARHLVGFCFASPEGAEGLRQRWDEVCSAFDAAPKAGSDGSPEPARFWENVYSMTFKNIAESSLGTTQKEDWIRRVAHIAHEHKHDETAKTPDGSPDQASFWTGVYVSTVRRIAAWEPGRRQEFVTFLSGAMPPVTEPRTAELRSATLAAYVGSSMVEEADVRGFAVGCWVVVGDGSDSDALQRMEALFGRILGPAAAEKATAFARSTRDLARSRAT